MMQEIHKNIPFYPDPVYRPLLKPVKIPSPKTQGNMDIDPEFNTDFEQKLSIPRGCNAGNITKAR